MTIMMMGVIRLPFCPRVSDTGRISMCQALFYKTLGLGGEVV